jgi:hypothetical protein
MFKRTVLCVLLFIAVGRGAHAQQYYGSKWGADGLGNTVVGGSGPVQGDYRFLATHTGQLKDVRTFFICAPGYGAGTGGSYRVDLETDDGSANHYPSGAVLSTTTEKYPKSLFVTETFASPATITTGQLYHVVYTDIDPSPMLNYCSLDMLYWQDPASSEAQPTVANTDWAHLYNGGTISAPVWHWRNQSDPSDGGNYMPILQLDYSDGASYGNGYMEVWIQTSRKTISGSNAARESFTVSGPTMNAASVTVRLRHDSGTDPLTVAVLNGTGTSLASCAKPYTAITPSGTSGDNWVTCQFASPLTLNSGSTYALNLAAPSSSAYTIFPIRKGVSYNFGPSSVFSDGHAQYTTGSGWQDWPSETGAASTQGDLQFYFTSGAASIAPTITTQPASVTINSGQVATFNVAATGTAPLSYQWLQNGVTISGATGATYITPAETTGSSFAVRVSNAAGSVTSQQATLAVMITAPAARTFTFTCSINDPETGYAPILSCTQPR